MGPSISSSLLTVRALRGCGSGYDSVNLHNAPHSLRPVPARLWGVADALRDVAGYTLSVGKLECTSPLCL